MRRILRSILQWIVRVPLIVLPFLLIFLAWNTYPAWVSLIFDAPTETSSLGVFGDSFGVLNTLFSGLAFAGIIISIFLQSKELNYTRRVLEDQRDQFKMQVSIMERQSFESTLLQLLQFRSDITRDMERVAKEYKEFEEDAFDSAFEMFYVFYKSHWYEQVLEFRDPSTAADIQYSYFFETVGSHLGPYMNTLERILEFIDTSLTSLKIDQYFYSKLLKAQLTDHELLLIFYHCMSLKEAATLKRLIEKYQMLEKLPDVEDVSNAELRAYHVNAFGANQRLLDAFEAG